MEPARPGKRTGTRKSVTRIRGAAVTALSASGAEPLAPPLRLPAEIPPVERARLEAVATRAFASARVEGPKHFMRPEVLEYLVDHPEFATQVTRALNLGRY